MKPKRKTLSEVESLHLFQINTLAERQTDHLELNATVNLPSKDSTRVNLKTSLFPSALHAKLIWAVRIKMDACDSESVQDKSVCMEQSFDHIDPLWNEPWHSCRPQIKPEDDNDTIPIDNMVKSLTSHYFSHFDMYL